MPGRGTPWRGVGRGSPDRIGAPDIKDDSITSDDIKDGTIQEVDLDSALQAKVNAGGDLLKTVTVSSNTISQTITLDTPVNFADYSEFQLIIHGVQRFNARQMKLRINGNSGSIYSYIGRESRDEVALGGDVRNPTDNGWRLASNDVEQDSEYYIKLTLQGGAILQATGTSGGENNPQRFGTGELSYNQNGSPDIMAVSRGGIKLFDFSDTTLVSFTLLDRDETNATIGKDTVLSIFGKKIV